MTAKRWGALGALVSGAVLAGCGEDGKSCSVHEDADGNGVLTCPDGSKATVYSGTNGTNGADGADGVDGVDGADGAAGATGPAGRAGADCNTTDKVDGTVTVVCGDGPVGTISDGTDGTDGTSCSVVDDPASGKQIRCSDGTSVDIVDGQDGASCSVTDNGDGTKTLSCTDGTVATVADGQDGSSCSVGDNGDGTYTMSCDDGSAVTWSAPRKPCSARFDDAWAVGASNVSAYYSAYGLTLAGAGDLLVGGASDGDPNSLGIDGTSGLAALRLDGGAHALEFGIVVRDAAIDLIRADHNVSGVMVEALRGGTQVAQTSLDLSVATSVATVRFQGIALDELRVTASGTIGLDYVRYDGVSCPDD